MKTESVRESGFRDKLLHTYKQFSVFISPNLHVFWGWEDTHNLVKPKTQNLPSHRATKMKPHCSWRLVDILYRLMTRRSSTRRNRHQTAHAFTRQNVSHLPAFSPSPSSIISFHVPLPRSFISESNAMKSQQLNPRLVSIVSIVRRPQTCEWFDSRRGFAQICLSRRHLVLKMLLELKGKLHFQVLLLLLLFCLHFVMKSPRLPPRQRAVSHISQNSFPSCCFFPCTCCILRFKTR